MVTLKSLVIPLTNCCFFRYHSRNALPSPAYQPTKPMVRTVRTDGALWLFLAYLLPSSYAHNI